MTEVPPTPPSDDQRQAVVARLTEHTGAGHLTLGEFDDRACRAYLAAVDADLAAVTADLPALGRPAGPERRARRWVVSLLGGATVSGGGQVSAARRPVHGADRVARFLIAMASRSAPGQRLIPLSVNNGPASDCSTATRSSPSLCSPCTTGGSGGWTWFSPLTS